jgi:formylmethanofuran dehydrogenase subunit E-like metal-binding protein
VEWNKYRSPNGYDTYVSKEYKDDVTIDELGVTFTQIKISINPITGNKFQNADEAKEFINKAFKTFCRV